MRRGKHVIAIGAETNHRLLALVEDLKAQGYHLADIPNLEKLIPALHRLSDAVILVYNPPGQDTARRVLYALGEHRRSNPVIVLVDRSEFDEYYELMCDGVFDYFEITGDLRWIEQAVRSAYARAAAA